MLQGLGAGARFPFVFPGQEGSAHQTLWSAGTPRCLAAGR